MQDPVESARAAGEIAMRAVADKADRVTPGWCAMALECLRQWAARQAGEFTIEEARRHIAQHLPEPHDLRAWGQVTRLARSADIIVQVGMRPAASSHGCMKPAYRSGVRA